MKGYLLVGDLMEGNLMKGYLLEGYLLEGYHLKSVEGILQTEYPSQNACNKIYLTENF